MVAIVFIIRRYNSLTAPFAHLANVYVISVILYQTVWHHISIYIIFYFAAAAAAVATVGVTTAVVVVVVGRVATETAGIGGVVGVVLIGALLSDGLTANATSNIVVVSTEIKVSEVITQLHIWQSPDVKQSMLYIHKITNGTVISV
jgi:hypothetical protein